MMVSFFRVIIFRDDNYLWNVTERRPSIDTRYLDNSTKNKAYRLETYRSLGTVSSANPTQLRCYFVAKCEFVKENPTEEVCPF